MGTEPSRLIGLMQLIDRIPEPPWVVRQGRPTVYPDRLFLKALVIMTARGLPSIHGLLMALAEPTAEMQALRQALTSGGRFPAAGPGSGGSRRCRPHFPHGSGAWAGTWSSRMATWTSCGRAVAMDSTICGPRRRLAPERPHRPASSRSVPSTPRPTGPSAGWHGWVYGWKLHVATTVADLWDPLAAS